MLTRTDRVFTLACLASVIGACSPQTARLVTTALGAAEQQRGRPSQTTSPAATDQAAIARQEGVRYFEEGNYMYSSMSFTSAIALSRQPDASLYASLGWARLNQGQMRAALTAFQEATSLDSELANAWIGLAETLKADLPETSSRYWFTSTIDAYANASRLRPDDPLVHYGAATAAYTFYSNPVNAGGQYHEADLQAAEQSADRALQLESRMVNGYLIRGLIRSLRGNLEGALADGNLAVALSPRDPYTHYVQSAIAERGGDKVLARDHIQQAIALNSNDRRYWDALNRLEGRGPAPSPTSVVRPAEPDALYLGFGLIALFAFLGAAGGNASGASDDVQDFSRDPVMQHHQEMINEAAREGMMLP